MLGGIFDEAIRDALLRGETKADIARLLNVPPYFISRRILRNGWRARGETRRGSASYGMTEAQREVFELYRRKRFTAAEAREAALQVAA